MVGDVFPHQPPEMLVGQRDHVIEYFTAGAADPAFRDSVLPRAPSTDENGLHAAGLQKLENIAAELGRPGQTRRTGRDPEEAEPHVVVARSLAGGTLRYSDVEDTSATMLDNKEAVKCAKGQAGNHKEIEGGDNFAVVVEEGQPTLRSSLHPSDHLVSPDNGKRWARRSRSRAGAVRRGCGARPKWDFPPSAFMRRIKRRICSIAPSPVAAPIDVAETQPPKQPESGTVPGNHGLRLDDD
jgi:hypothetical protein